MSVARVHCQKILDRTKPFRNAASSHVVDATGTEKGTGDGETAGTEGLGRYAFIKNWASKGSTNNTHRKNEITRSRASPGILVSKICENTKPRGQEPNGQGEHSIAKLRPRSPAHHLVLSKT